MVHKLTKFQLKISNLPLQKFVWSASDVAILDLVRRQIKLLKCILSSGLKKCNLIYFRTIPSILRSMYSFHENITKPFSRRLVSKLSLTALCVKQCNYKRSKVCKSKPNGEKLLKFCKNDFFEEKTWTNCAFLGKKTKGWSHKLEILDEDNFSPVQKNLEFVAAALHCEFYISNIQIFSKYFHNLDEQKYFDSVFKGYGQLVPSILYTSFPQPVWIATDSLAI